YGAIDGNPARDYSSTGGRERIPYRFMGLTDGTSLSYDPEPPFGAPLTLSANQVATVWTSKTFSVRSQDAEHPFYIVLDMTSNGSFGDDNGVGDPELVGLFPTQQFLRSYRVPPGGRYSVVRTKPSGKSFAPVYERTPGCSVEIVGWMPVGTDGRFEVAY